ncbi:aspartyl/glutamyl-tRNA(Asn/Gln) amidotransferase subunit B [Schizosaccharomyces octosporus yFS286]|uniref:Aspartyl/glutamyl-tRNA(Asn/Gln) amidotransferase subunit B n=1 Tax=Schizosaccharomyces octosporus (strain yFS286) TaxID=483514 RepID=S9R507_SCHOY|nr:aspartyl/glutamyl-tRNA(Asn/Gln) amidotransferase subunit B [Schizosaccharomyces octosporus yFS286]EPX73430.1 aspartyl/glutamyl-tRNA(Asn/Gln) amidotransferase subunit B [Schizosaccharomyces octosporus yFS286]
MMNSNICIGLEVRFKLAATKKLFSSAYVKHETPNTSIAYFDAALPGSMPALNPEALRLAVQGALALNCDIASVCQFDRKLTFHPDSLAGYQITQHEMPLGENGYIDLSQNLDGVKNIRIPIQSVKLEQDIEESVRMEHPKKHFLNFNRAGSSMIKIVVPPCLHDEQIAGALLYKLRMVLLHAGLLYHETELDGMQCRVSISSNTESSNHKNLISGVKPFETELENLFLIKNVMAAIQSEVRRQFSPAEENDPFQKQVRAFDEKTGRTFFLREKPLFENYLYVPETDIPPISLSKSYIEKLKQTMCPQPDALYATLTSKPYMLSNSEARALLCYAKGYSYFTSVWDAIISQKSVLCNTADDLQRSLASSIVTALSSNGSERLESVPPKQLADFILNKGLKKGSLLIFKNSIQ